MVHTIVDRFAPRQVVVFGSYARGEASRESDVDFWVVLDHASNRRALAVQIRLALNPRTLPIDVIVATPDRLATVGMVRGTVLHAALDEGVTLYQRVV